MASLILTLETVTPLLMNGADQTPEIRAASFRGALRYWMRTVLGGNYQGNIAALKAEESLYFGSTEAGSSLRVRVEHGLTPTTSRTKYVLPPTVRNKQGQPVPMRHPGFHESTREDPQRLRLILDTHPLRSDTSMFTSPLYAALLLAFQLGGVGKRARRGGGILRVIGCKATFALDEQFTNDVCFQADSQSSLVDFLDNNLAPFIRGAQGTVPRPGGSIPPYPVWLPDHIKVLVGPEGYDDDPQVKPGEPQPPFHEGYRTALQDLWEVSGRLNLHHNVDAWGYARGNRRRASAVHLRVHYGTDGLYYPLVTMFRSRASDHQWGQLEIFDRELQRRGYRKLTVCTGVW